VLSEHREDRREAVLSALQARGLLSRQQASGWWAARCPAHDDRTPSLSVSPDGGLHCFAGCPTPAVLEALGLREERPESSRPHRRAPALPANAAASSKPGASEPSQADQTALTAWVERCAARLDQVPRVRQMLRDRWPKLTDDDIAALRLGADPGGQDPERPQCLSGLSVGPRLIIPLRDPEGRVLGLQGRYAGTMDNAHRWAGPTGRGWPCVGAFRLDREGPVVVTEGPSDALAVVSAGFAAIAVVGASRAREAAEVIRRWAAGRAVVVAGDNDEAGQRFADKLGQLPKAKRLALPEGVNDLAEWAARDPAGFPDALRRSLEEATAGLKALRCAGAYEATAEGLWRWSPTGEERQQITTADLEIAEIVTYEDEKGRGVVYHIIVRHRGRERVILVNDTEFERPTRWLPRCGFAGATILPRMGNEVVPALHILSTKAQETVRYSQLGWHEVNGEMVYLHAGGAIGRNGPVPNIRLELGEPLDSFQLPEPPTGDQLRADLQAALALLEVGPDQVTVPVFGAVWRAALGDPGWSLILAGRTGLGKSTLAALAQAFWKKDAETDHLPLSFMATGNALADYQYRAADTLLVVDDYVPEGGERGRALQSTADRVVRGAANHAGRARLRADGNSQPIRSPRCLTLMTAETVPPGRSLRARAVVVELTEEDRIVHAGGDGREEQSERLTAAQEAAKDGAFTRVMAAWVQWIAGQGPEALRNSENASRGTPLSKALAQRTGHARVASNLNEIVKSWELALGWAEEVGAISDAERGQLIARVIAAVDQLAEAQRIALSEATPGQLVLDLLASGLRTGKVQLLGPGEPVPTSPAEAALVIGWNRGSDVLLEPQAALAAAKRLAEGLGQSLPLTTPRSLSEELRALGALAASDPGHLTVRLKTGNRRPRVLVLPRRALYEESIGDDEPGGGPNNVEPACW
jgi:hypothetical protein